ncbi:hypothetical protein APA_4559 [Pseudanabaena sp. lw0831]|uniref:hypothetical protein n=1 Tax=Pseudanabaena sp. lw0831 TaxID=1357935 RepID=UPI0019160CCC|nr:hypothetical protein [Pseudanabaena sp. lw0831]GBO56229.1 hypothetical protein APA_4559 [Pseudanabaena sp. lw0831]
MGYNKGDNYEQNIFDLLTAKGLIAIGSTRGGAGNTTDIKFLHDFQEYNLEVKLDLEADYGQKMLRWNDGIWSWCVDDAVTSFYTSVGVLDIVNAKNFIPNRYSIARDEITAQHKNQDQKAFEDKVEIDINSLYNFYSGKDCYYIQIGGYGFYHLKQDILSLGTPQFDCRMKLRLRAKTIHSIPVYKYGFYAVLKVDKKEKPKKSCYDLEQKYGREFPPII